MLTTTPARSIRPAHRKPKRSKWTRPVSVKRDEIRDIVSPEWISKAGGKDLDLLYSVHEILDVAITLIYHANRIQCAARSLANKSDA